CAEFGCGENQCQIESVYFDGMYLDKDADPGAPVKLLRYAASEDDLKDNNLATLDVVDGQFVSSADTVVGGVLEVGVDGKTYIILIAEQHETQQFWTVDHERVITYSLKYKDPSTLNKTYIDLCTTTDPGPGWATKMTDAIVFDGDKYGPKMKVTDTWNTPASTWFNIACAGSVPAKLYLLRQTLSSHTPDLPPPSREQRQAFVYMYTASYCGDGHSFTASHEPLAIRDDALIPNEPPVSFASFADLESKEAVWNESGAVCIDTPRREKEEPGTRDEVLRRCEAVGHRLGTCSDFPGWPETWKARGMIVTGSPKPSPPP